MGDNRSANRLGFGIVGGKSNEEHHGLRLVVEIAEHLPSRREETSWTKPGASPFRQ
jgi:hypothetical protein